MITPELENQLIAWRRYFHQHPEVSLREYATTETIRGILQSQQIATRPIGETGLCCDIAGSSAASGKTILLRADIDALGMEEQSDTSYRSRNPGAAHACGHDGHTAALLGAAQVLSENRHAFTGTVRLIFQPAEEICKGARQVIEAGELENVDRVLGIHFMPSIPCGKIACPAGPVMAGCDFFSIMVQGKGGHISTPQLAADPLFPAAQILSGLNTIAARYFSPLEEILVAVGKFSGGTQYNIIPAEAVLEGTIRYYDKENRSQAMQAIREIAVNTAAACRTSAKVAFEEFTPPTINAPEAAILGQETAAGIVGAENVISEPLKALAGDDFAFYSEKVPGLYAKIGSADPNRPETQHPLHHPSFDIDERALAIAAEFYVRYALQYLNAGGEV